MEKINLTTDKLAAAATAKSLQSCPTLWDRIDNSSPGSPVPGILQARTRVGCHFLLQCMKVKSQSEVAQSCLTLSDPMDCSLPCSSVHGIFQARVLEWKVLIKKNNAINVWGLSWPKIREHPLSFGTFKTNTNITCDGKIQNSKRQISVRIYYSND